MTTSEIQTMFENAVHIGHRTQKWNPQMKKFIHGEKNGIHIIDLEKTVQYLEKALDFLAKLAAEGRTILFVSTKPQSVKLLKEISMKCNMPYVVTKWIPGLLTNYPTIKGRIKHLANLKNQQKTGEFEKYTKKEASKLLKEIDKLQTALGGVENMTDAPDAVFIIDTVRDRLVVKEARKLHIPVVGIVDTNADPMIVDYPIPGNDDAIKSLTYILNKIESAIQKSHKPKK